MGAQISRVTIQGLRSSDPSSLSVLVQDVLHLPMSQIEPLCLMDLMALSEIPDQLSKELGKDLSGFADRVVRELGDLPDGPPLASFCVELAGLDAELIPASVRVAIQGIKEDRSSSEAADAITQFLTHVDSAGPMTMSLPTSPPDDSAEAKTEVVAAKAAPKKRRRSTLVSDERAEWITEDVLSRVVKYGNRGLKEQVIVAGCRHRSPFSDLTESEVLAVLRRMKREGRIRHSAGRWMSL